MTLFLLRVLLPLVYLVVIHLQGLFAMKGHDAWCKNVGYGLIEGNLTGRKCTQSLKP